MLVCFGNCASNIPPRHGPFGRNNSGHKAGCYQRLRLPELHHGDHKAYRILTRPRRGRRCLDHWWSKGHPHPNSYVCRFGWKRRQLCQSYPIVCHAISPPLCGHNLQLADPILLANLGHLIHIGNMAAHMRQKQKLGLTAGSLASRSSRSIW